MSLDPSVQQDVVNGLTRAYSDGVQDGLIQAQTLYFGKSARILTGALFAAALSEAAQLLRPHDQEAAAFFGEQATEFQAWVTPPQVQSHEPPDGATGVVLNNPISAKFVTPGLQGASVTPDTVYVTPASGGTHLSGELTYDESTCTVAFAPTNLLSPDTAYKVTLDAGLTAAGGLTLGTPVTFGFTTGDA